MWLATQLLPLYLQRFLTFFSVEFLVGLDVTSTGLFSTCARFLFPVLLFWGELCCVVLCCVALRYDRCVVIHCVTSAFCCDSFIVSAVLRRIALWSVVLCYVVLFTSSAFLVFRLCWSCTSRQTRPTSLTGTGKASRRIDKVEHCELGETTDSKNPPTLLAIFSDDRKSFAIFFLICEVSQLNSIFFRNIKFSTL